MIAVIFEVTPVAEHKQTYLGIAADLRPMLYEIEGFISIERFGSLSEPTKILSLSFWRDEDAVKQWRNTSEHRNVQHAGRTGVFAGYRLRIAQVVRDYGLDERAEVPIDSRAFTISITLVSPLKPLLKGHQPAMARHDDPGAARGDCPGDWAPGPI